jgi:hypothetical protein
MDVPFAQRLDESAIGAFVLISIAYLVLLWLTTYIAMREFKLVGAGLLTAVAAMAYGTLVLPTGPMLAPQMMKLAVVLVLGGLVLSAVDRARGTTPEDRP